MPVQIDVYQDGGCFYAATRGADNTRVLSAPFAVPDFDLPMAFAARRWFEVWCEVNDLQPTFEE